jgi:hypothetical protein
MNPFFCEKTVLNRFPKFELSYETISHKKVSSEKYNVAIAIPQGKKHFAWFSFHEKKNVCYLFELNRDKKIAKTSMKTIPVDHSIALGTIVYGTLLDTEFPVFVVEDIYFYKGISVKNFVFSQKLGIIENMFYSLEKHPELTFAFPYVWKWNDSEIEVPQKIIDDSGYPIHHIQYRSFDEIMPYVNLSTKQKTDTKIVIPQAHWKVVHKFDYNKPQYKHSTVFEIKADAQFDIYHLFAFGENKSRIYCGITAIPTYKNSVFMNSNFRNIRENRNLDYIEESDDEDDFENAGFSKYVNLEKTIVMECVFHNRFKKWIPVRLANPSSPIVHISRL